MRTARAAITASATILAALASWVGCSLAVDTEHLRNGTRAGDAGGADGDSTISPDSPPFETSTTPVIGRVYVYGGIVGSTHPRQILRTNFHADGTIDDWQTEAEPLPGTAVASARSISGTSIYVVGPDVDDPDPKKTTVRTTNFGVDGLLTGWSSNGGYTAARSKLATAVSNQHLFAIGGEGASNNKGLTEVYKSTIATDGSLGPWSTTDSLPSARCAHAAAGSGDRIWAIGGYDAAGADLSSMVEGAVATDGTIAWYAESDFGSVVIGGQALVSGNHLYVIGGYGHGRKVTYSKIESTGKLAGFNTSGREMLAHHAFFGAAVVADKYLIALGGFDETQPDGTSTVEIAPLDASGTPGSWSLGRPLPEKHRYNNGFATPVK